MRRVWLALLLAACHSYDPDLGAEPFQCGMDPPKCPDGYTAVDVNDPRGCVCQRAAVVPDAGPAYQCNADEFDANGHNDTVAQATPTPLLAANQFELFSNLAVCPADDRDVFAIGVDKAGTTITVRVFFSDPDRKPPKIDILDRVGASLGPTIKPKPFEIDATLSALSAGTYYAQVTSENEINYSIRFELAPPGT